MSAQQETKEGRTLRRRLGFSLGLRLLLAWVLTTLAVTDAVETIQTAPPESDGDWHELPSASAIEEHLHYRLRECAGFLESNATETSRQGPKQLQMLTDSRAVQITIAPRINGEPARTIAIAQGLDERREAIREIVLAMPIPPWCCFPSVGWRYDRLCRKSLRRSRLSTTS